MPKAFSVLSWNIEHLKGKRPDRLFRIVNTIKFENPDIFALYEVEGKTVYNSLLNELPGYSFHITEGPQTQEILVAVKHKFTAFFSQRVEFKSSFSRLRPGAMLSVRIEGQDYSLMFLHLKSQSTPIGLGVRDVQFASIYKLKRKLDKLAGNKQKANFIVLGDFNTMGMNYSGKKYDIPASAELARMDNYIRRRSVAMRRLSKTCPNTWSNGSGSSYPPADLDQVLVAKHLKTRLWHNKLPVNEKDPRFNSGQAEVDIRGWVDQATIEEQDKWIENYSDHCYLYFEVTKPAT
ncbi:endonuclease/exonuclease/phosphatase family protein [Thalassomonas viridans]|uniref:Endonuclease/exonuclease/phosphatase family protein n=1 Tax=Thalassomonas viridans TaxID=137584 RepID=A0AAE9Z1X4_9GAMM|nr:endonuclease/exonuclease/phosphatase family protein [Thalassomonas viridans]WDE05291.1 endonuclease/exonuclease/phosphatase family protein [Thalassomonas viridans]